MPGPLLLRTCFCISFSAPLTKLCLGLRFCSVFRRDGGRRGLETAATEKEKSQKSVSHSRQNVSCTMSVCGGKAHLLASLHGVPAVLYHITGGTGGDSYLWGFTCCLLPSPAASWTSNTRLGYVGRCKTRHSLNFSFQCSTYLNSSSQSQLFSSDSCL